MTFDDLAGLLQTSRFLPRGEPVERAALRAVPELADGMPAVRLDPRGPKVWSGCADAVRAAAVGLPGQLSVAARVDAGPDTERQLASDPLVTALAALVEEGARHAPGAAVVPLLEAVRVSWEAQGELGTLHRAGDGPALRRVGAAVQARLAQACALASAKARVPALAWAVARSRLLPLYARGTLDRDPAWQTLAAVLDVPLPPGTVDAAEAAVRLAVKGVAERRASGRSTPDDATLLLRCLAGRLDGGPEAATAALMLDPDGLAALLPSLGRYVDAKALVSAGVEKGRAERILSPDGGLAVASVLIEILGAVRTWDVLSQLTTAVVAAPVKALTVPRGSATKAAVVAVHTGRLGSDGGASAWEELVRGAEAGVADDGVIAFPDAVDALRFALAARARIPTAALALTWGAVSGGTDGGRARLTGPAVEAAHRWLATTSAEGPGLRHIGGWITGSGLAVDAPAADAIRDTRIRRGLATAADGPPGGDPRVPRSLDLLRASEFDGSVLAFVRIPGVAGGYEALHMATAAWRDLLDKDGAPVPEPPRAAPPPPSPAAAFLGAPIPAPTVEIEHEESAGWEMTDADELPEEAPVTLDLAENTGEVYARAAQPGFEFDTRPGAPTEEEEAPFTGFFLPGAETAARAAAPKPPPTPAAPTFDMLVEDEEEETQEWGSPAPGFAASPAPRPAPRLVDPPPILAVDPFGDDPFADPYADPFPVPEELRDPATPAGGDPFADPFAAVGPAPNETVGDPFSSAGPAPAHVARDERVAAADEETSEPVSASSSSGRARGVHAERSAPTNIDFDFLLKGYACFFEKKEAVFGRPYGTRIVDRHVYPYAGDPDEAYLAFLRDKIREGFVPRADMMGDLPRGVTLMPLDPEKLQRAWQDLS